MPVEIAISKESGYKLEVKVTNTSGTSKIINVYEWGIPSLIVEVTDAKGSIIHPLPPPVPNPVILEASEKTIKPGESMTFFLQGLGIDEKQLTGQGYRIRCKGYLQNPANGEWEPISSTWKNLD